LNGGGVLNGGGLLGGESEVPIDPRFRQRLIEVRRHEGRRRLRLVVGALASAGVVAAAWGVSRSPLLDVDHVRLTGAKYTQPLSVIQTAGSLPGRPMIDLDEGAAASQIERLPWIADARVRREWPNTVVIDVRERAPAASVPAKSGGWALVDGTGRVLEPVGEAPADRPLLEGVPPAGEPGTEVSPGTRAPLEVARALTPAMRLYVAVVVRASDGELQLRLRSEGVVHLGDRDALAAKLLAAETMLAHVDDSNAVAALDVRVPESPVLTRW
jgi:cell division protein FtsQ